VGPVGESVTTAEVKYFVLADSTSPYLLARVRWPDIAQAITAGCREWQDDPGLFDLPYDPISATVTSVQAAAIAAAWGARLPADDTVKSPLPPLIRRMPANWSDLSPAEIRAWSLDYVMRGRRAVAASTPSQGRAGRSRWSSRLGRRRSSEVTERREHARVLVGGQAQIRLGPKTVTADLVDVSPGGMHCVVLDTQAVLEAGRRVGRPIVLHRDAPENQIRLDVTGTVTWRSDVGLGTHFGVAFGSLNKEQAARIHDLLATSGAEPSS